MSENQMKKIRPGCTYDELTPAGMIYGSGNAKEFMTGDWRIATPNWKADACRQCLLCFPVCPDSSIPVKDSKRGDFDFDHCKGCGICARVCPFNAIEFSDGEGE